MAAANNLRHDIDNTKRELKNIRQEILKQKADIKAETEKIKSLLYPLSPEIIPDIDEKSIYSMTPIGYVSTCFKFKNGIPRQPSLCPTAKGILKIEKTIFTNPEHSLIGLNEFSHVWILFVFHDKDNVSVKAKVHPPRLNGKSVGVFSTRSPHRPSALGLSLSKLDKIEDDTLFLSGIDLLDGTPVVDIKPYIPMYDNPLFHSKTTSTDLNEVVDSDFNTAASHIVKSDNSKTSPSTSSSGTDAEKNGAVITSACKVPDYLHLPPQKLEVLFTKRALNDLETLNTSSKSSVQGDIQPQPNNHMDKTKQAIIEILQNDPRSVYRKEKCSDKLYYFYLDQLHITCWFDDSIAEVLRLKLSTNMISDKVSCQL